MSLENAVKFMIASVNDQALSDEISAAVKAKGSERGAETFAALATSRGYACTAAEAAQLRASFMEAKQLSDEDLDKVAGGIADFGPRGPGISDVRQQGWKPIPTTIDLSMFDRVPSGPFSNDQLKDVLREMLNPTGPFPRDRSTDTFAGW